MKAMILCGGYGTRLREFTDVRPKPMVDIGGRPILWHIMKHYLHHGIDDFVLCLGYKGAVIKEYFLAYRAMSHDFTIDFASSETVEYHDSGAVAEAWRVTLVDTGEKTMTGGRIQRASRYLEKGETFAVTYGDGLTDADLGRSLAFHRDQGAAATMLGAYPRSRFGELVCDGTRVTSFSEKPDRGCGLVNGGFFFFEPRFLDYLSNDQECVLEREPLERCARDGELRVFEHRGFWHCMDTLRDWQQLHEMWDSGRAPWRTW